MTPDIDKLQTFLQWTGGIAVIVVTAMAAVWKVIKGSGDEPDRVRDDRERAERSKRYQLERENEMLLFEMKFQKVIESVRVSILSELTANHAMLRQDFQTFNARLAAVEREAREVDNTPHPRRPR